MASQKKVDYVNKLTAKLEEHPNFAIIDFDSLSHKSLEELKTSLRSSTDTTLKVIKNSLFHVALNRFNATKKILNKDEATKLKDTAIKGQSAVIFLQNDWLSGLQGFFKASKPYSSVFFKGGVIDGTLYFRDKLDVLAQLPSREVLMGKILGSLKAPQYSLVRSLKWDAGRFVRVLNGIKDKQTGAPSGIQETGGET